MDDFIKRKDVIEAFDDPAVERNYGDVDPDSVIRVIKVIPAADVRPVVHGRWEWIKDYDDMSPVGHRICSVCGHNPTDQLLPHIARFCPNCGADMRGNNG